MASSYSILHKDQVLDLNLRVARGFFARSWGWLSRTQIGPQDALWIEPCARVHCFFMRVPIAVVMLDLDGYVVDFRDPVRPWELGPRGAAGGVALELAPGAVSRLGIGLGDRLTLKASSR